MSTSPRSLHVLGRTALAGGLQLLRIERDRDFRAGQYLGLTLPPAPGEPPIPPRLYSIASGEGEPFWELLYAVEEEGHLTPRLALLEAGDSLLVEGPSGSFAEDQGTSGWVAGGTGIAPFVSLARSGKAPGGYLIHAASRPELFYGAELFEGLLGTSYHRCCSRAEEGDDRFFRGRTGAFIGQAEDLPLDLPWLLCGGSEFVVSTRASLLARGIPYARILAEVYF